MSTLDLTTLNLKAGSHTPASGEMCFLEAVSIFSGAEFTDRPSCVCPTLSEIGRAWNDNTSAANRQALKKYIPLLPGTYGGRALADKRTWAYVDWTIRTALPMWMSTETALVSHAELLRARDLDRALARDPALARASALALDRDIDLASALARARDIDLALDLARARALDRDIDPALDLARAIQASKHAMYSRLITMQAAA